MIALLLAGVAAIVALLTWILGWWAVLVVGAVAGATWRRPSLIALASVLGWAALLAIDARSGRLGALATVLGGIFPAPGWALMLVTLLFAALAGWSVATISEALARRFTSTT
jgi:hypothetical protein